MTASKIVAAAASGVGGAGLDIDEVFRTFLYTGTGSQQTIVNDIDLSGEGGLVWTKSRSNTSTDHHLNDTERGADKALITNSDAGQASSGTYSLNQFNSNGFRLDGGGNVNASSQTYCSWTFRKAPHFFDVVTWTGTGSTRTLNHSLGTNIGMIIIKCTSSSYDWNVFHRGVGGYMSIRLRDGEAGSTGTTFFNNATTTQFTITGGGNTLNATGETYVAYLFAHNNGDGNFGPDSDQDVIKCGTYTGDGNATGALQNLGFEPQYIMIKNTNLNTERWHIFDSARGIFTGSNDPRLDADYDYSELSHETVQVEPNGFRPMSSDDKTNGNGRSYLYMAIRRGPLAVPEDSSKVFDVNVYANNGNSNEYNTGFDVDMNINTRTGASTTYLMSRLTNGYFQTTNNTNETAGQVSIWNTKSNLINLNTGWWGSTSDVVSWSWKRAPSYFDQVAWDGNGTARTINHTLNAAPEMIWVKRRSATEDWTVYHSGGGVNKYYQINSTGTGGTSSTAGGGAANIWNGTAPTSSVFSIGTHDRVNTNGQTYHGFLFATAPGVSKVGYYTGSSGTVDVDCGFTNGAKFILIKLVSHSGYGWYVFDNLRGIVAGNDPHLRLNESTGSEVTSADAIDPLSSGFQVNTPANATAGLNYQGYVYIFYAVAA